MRLGVPVCVLALAALSTCAKADVVETFSVSGVGYITVYPDPQYPDYTIPPPVDLPNGTASGTFTYDFTTNSVLSENVSLNNGLFSDGELSIADLLFADAQSYCSPYFCEYGTLNTSGGSFYLRDDEDQASTPEGSGRLGQVYVGTFTVATPEPSSFALLGTGLLAAAGTFRRRLPAAPIRKS